MKNKKQTQFLSQSWLIALVLLHLSVDHIFGQVVDTGDKVGIGINPPLEKLHVSGSVRGNLAGGALRINTSYGYLDIGPMNGSWAHLQTDRDKFYFNKSVHVDGVISSYNNNDLFLGTNGIARITSLYSNGYVGIGTNAPQGRFQVNSVRPVIIKDNGGSGVYGSEIGFNAVLNTSVVPNQFKKLGGTSQQGGASLAVDYTGNMLFQMYNAGTLDEAIINYAPQVVFKNDGNVGIGTTTPAETLHLNGNIRGNQAGALRVSTGYGYVDIGPKNTSWAHFYTDRPRFYFEKGITVNEGLIGSYDEDVQIQTSGVTRLRIQNGDGNVGIGTDSPGSFKLAVNGKVWAQEVQVALTNPGPDYVFSPNYKLLSLEEIKAYIDQHKHLPEVPSAKEMETNGVNVSEMNMLLLKKIEELTLLMIQLKEENNDVKFTVSKQGEIIKSLTGNK